MTMMYTSDGLLHTELTRDQLFQMLVEPRTTVAPRFCPFGYSNREWIDNREQFKLIYLEQLDPSEIDFIGTEPMKGIVHESIEREVLAHMDDRFWGPIHGTPGPVIYKQDCIESWSDWVMYRLTKHGDMEDQPS